MDPLKGVTDFETARADPARVFDSPEDIVDAQHLTNDQKLALLRSWKLDEQRLQSSASENMTGGETNQLKHVQDAINRVREMQQAGKEKRRHSRAF